MEPLVNLHLASRERRRSLLQLSAQPPRTRSAIFQ